MTRKRPLTSDRHVKPINLSPEQTELIRRQISSLVNEAIQDMQKQMTVLVQEQRRMATVLEQMTRHHSMTGEETMVHADDRDESELPLWMASADSADSATGDAAHAKTATGESSRRHDTHDSPNNVDDGPAMKTVSQRGAPPSRPEEELALDLFPVGHPLPAERTEAEDPHEGETHGGVPAKAPMQPPAPPQFESEAIPDPTAGATIDQSPMLDLSGMQDAGVVESTGEAGGQPPANPIFFPPEDEPRPALGRFIWAVAALVLMASAFWLGRLVMAPEPASMPDRTAAMAPAPGLPAPFQRIDTHKNVPAPPIHPLPVTGVIPRLSEETPPDTADPSTPDTATAPHPSVETISAPVSHWAVPRDTASRPSKEVTADSTVTSAQATGISTRPSAETMPEPINHPATAPPTEPTPVEDNEFDPAPTAVGALSAIPTPEAAPRETAGETPIPLPRHPYAILMASVRTSTQANKAVAQYRQMGLSPYWVEVDLEDRGIWYRVFCGHFETPEGAERQIEEKGLVKALVKHTPG